jgi:phosphoenolpyruvate-protein kinase (PTS system EI component)
MVEAYGGLLSGLLAPVLRTQPMPDSSPPSCQTLVGPGDLTRYGQGTVYIYHAGTGRAPPRRSIAVGEVVSKQQRLARAIAGAIRELENIQVRVLSEIGEAESQILGSHLALLEEHDFTAKIEQRIAAHRINAEAALEHEADALGRLLSAVENEYFRERVQDIVDIKNRVLKHLGHGSAETLERLPPATVLVATELLPSDTSAIRATRFGETS